MKDTLQLIISQYSLIFFVHQVLAIIGISMAGFVLMSLTVASSRNTDTFDRNLLVLLSFPIGLALFVVCGITVLTIGIPYNVFSVTGVSIVVIAITGIFSSFSLSKIKEIFTLKYLLLSLIIVIVLILISVSGIISISFSNDSMYYYYAYPHEIAYSGILTNKYDTFLTDAGQGTAIINTIPFLFGFNESFGIHTFFVMNFIAMFAYSLYTESVKHYNARISCVISAIFTLLMISMMPFVVLSKWILANIYFTGFVFIMLVVNKELVNKENNILIIRSLLMMCISFIRIEGALFVGFLVLTYLTTKEAKRNELILLTVPAVILQCMYFIRIFLLMNIQASDTFMTKEKALIAVLFNIFVVAYGCIFLKFSYSEKPCNAILKFIKKIIYTPEYVVFIGLVLVNAALFILDHKLFISNTIVFAVNLLQTGGWGLFPAILIGMIIIVPKVKIKDNYYDYFWIGFLLLAFAACFARGDELRADINDSGNRVMLQIVPFVIYAFGYRFIKAFDILFRKEQE